MFLAVPSPTMAAPNTLTATELAHRIDAGAVNVAPLAGLVIDTVGVPPPPPEPLQVLPLRVKAAGAVLVPV